MATRSGDPTVLETVIHDTTMDETGEKWRPPGDPPDSSQSWARKVQGSSEGGMPIPEEVIDEEFVRARLRVEFPNGEDGEAEITIENEVLEAMNGLWKNCMIVKVLGRYVPIATLNRRLREMWKPVGQMYVLDLPKQFFLVRFEREDEFTTVLTGGPWRIFGSHLMVKAWYPGFDPLRDEIITTPVWVRLSHIPVNLYHNAILMGIARGFGHPLKVDLTTLRCERARYARVCVEVNIKKPLKGSVLVNGERYCVAYEGLGDVCSLCGIFGHMVHSCSRKGQEREKPETSSTPNMGSDDHPSVPVSQDEGFVTVRGKGRKTGSFSSPLTKTGEGSRSVVVRNQTGSGRKVSAEKIVTSNRFGNLPKDVERRELLEIAGSMGGNKENLTPANPNQKGENVSENTLVVFDAGKDTRNLLSGQKDKKAIKGTVLCDPNYNDRFGAARGLVFGTSKNEIELPSSGKRPRIEHENLGISGTVFTGKQIVVENEMGMDQVATKLGSDSQAAQQELGTIPSPEPLEEEENDMSG